MDDKNLDFISNEMLKLIRRASLDKKHGGLDRSSYTLLHHLSSHDNIGVKALAEEFGLDTSTISRQISVLELKEYIERIPDPQDGRSSYFQITELGSQRLAEAKKIRMNRYEQIFQNWSPQECRTFGDSLARLNRTLAE
ncbi:MarR family transcriptional regulator [Paenibacillus sp. 7124]|uniref:MarR family transcriptional regulator n=1 Tax=Paenibacillus apii TaxID=1850370 RepID=A0A6M1PMM7_9BACL|nr:MarR family transcriptional regulator [Paenibacillus apii]NGM83395.1 MarR family transcriptional regulator [Paenibacillus apii]NJJ39026.1 MarR family transcriptional regulator [Paenibacillus apii]